MDAYALLAAAAGRVICLEQLICKLLETLQVGAVRKSICNKPNADKALSICFCCKSSAEASKGEHSSGHHELRRRSPYKSTTGSLSLASLVPQEDRIWVNQFGYQADLNRFDLSGLGLICDDLKARFIDTSSDVLAAYNSRAIPQRNAGCWKR